MPPKSAPKWIKGVVDLGPLLVFLVAYYRYDIRVATGALMVATVAAVAIGYLLTRRVSTMQKFTLVMVLSFGGLTLALQDTRFVKIKPTAVQGLIAILLFGGAILKRPTLQFVLGEALKLSDEGWRQLTWRYAFFFAGMAVLNEIVWRNFSESLWVDFKVFGILALTLLFSLSQMPLMKRHMIETDEVA